jgi:20S proteasome alpha/beta subunit
MLFPRRGGGLLLHHQLVLFFVWIYCLSCCLHICSGNDLEGRYSFSLTTFDQKGKLGQVERASQAAALGTPIVAVVVACQSDTDTDRRRIILASPQALPHALIKDDGTARFSPISPHIAVAHSGISADGRVLVAAAQRLAIEHAYTFDEPIPIELFLEEVSLMFQEYTMKVAARPFGVVLLVAHCPTASASTDSLSGQQQPQPPQLYRIDPSGGVTSLGNTCAVINFPKGGRGGTTTTTASQLEERLEQMALRSSAKNQLEEKETTTVEQDRRELAEILSAALDIPSTTLNGNKKSARDSSLSSSSSLSISSSGSSRRSLTIVTASLTRDQSLVVQRHEPNKKTKETHSNVVTKANSRSTERR